MAAKPLETYAVMLCVPAQGAPDAWTLLNHVRVACTGQQPFLGPASDEASAHRAAAQALQLLHARERAAAEPATDANTGERLCDKIHVPSHAWHGV